jgi:hypothetical protein
VASNSTFNTERRNEHNRILPNRLFRLGDKTSIVCSDRPRETVRNSLKGCFDRMWMTDGHHRMRYPPMHHRSKPSQVTPRSNWSGHLSSLCPAEIHSFA